MNKTTLLLKLLLILNPNISILNLNKTNTFSYDENVKNLKLQILETIYGKNIFLNFAILFVHCSSLKLKLERNNYGMKKDIFMNVKMYN